MKYFLEKTIVKNTSSETGHLTDVTTTNIIIHQEIYITPYKNFKSESTRERSKNKKVSLLNRDQLHTHLYKRVDVLIELQ